MKIDGSVYLGVKYWVGVKIWDSVVWYISKGFGVSIGIGVFGEVGIDVGGWVYRNVCAGIDIDVCDVVGSVDGGKVES